MEEAKSLEEARLFHASRSVDLALPLLHIMEEFTGDEASKNNQIFPEDNSSSVSQDAAPVAVPSYAPDSHVPTADVRTRQIIYFMLNYTITTRALRFTCIVGRLSSFFVAIY